MGIDLSWLEKHFFKQGLSTKQKSLITDTVQVSEYAKGDVIVAQGNAGDAIYVIHSGSAYIDCHCNGETVRVGTAKTCDLVGEMSFLTEDEASATVTAKEDCIIYKLTRNSFTSLMHEDPDLVYAIFAHLLTHTAKVIRQMNAEKAAIQHYMAGNHF